VGASEILPSEGEFAVLLCVEEPAEDEAIGVARPLLLRLAIAAGTCKFFVPIGERTAYAACGDEADAAFGVRDGVRGGGDGDGAGNCGSSLAATVLDVGLTSERDSSWFELGDSSAAPSCLPDWLLSVERALSGLLSCQGDVLGLALISERCWGSRLPKRGQI